MQDMDGLNRRAMLERMALLLGATAIPAEALMAAAKSKVRMTAKQFALLSAVAGTILPKTDTPGAVEVGVPKLIDGLLHNWASAKRRASLIGALERIDAMAVAQGGKPFVAQKPANRLALLKAHDVAALKPAPRTDGLTSIAAMLAGSSVSDAGYGKLKELIVTLYYSSQIALTKELSYDHNPGKWQPSIPITPSTRPAAGGGPF